ncbi:hypothetical protein K469DRAFT_722120 [Zopfia rhizophila CBS 207.26]|uniref:ATP-dependent RNA helicase DHX8 n=1 Tax=Zopfia rhizophila CBS 207.26 TaxID=1314779 RepID=A0A6A6DE01_9PEZI|nr:hypothetical protein K469DRAFT_722120 [Zopfia rhizophila CBS 207.26]
MASPTPTLEIPKKSSTPSTSTPYRQIRAHYDDETITVYQAYSASIAVPAVKHQKLNASPEFSTARMTWIKPSWAWMLYRSGYSYKDLRQTHILALKMTHSAFLSLLSKAVLSHGEGSKEADSNKKTKNEGRARPDSVRVQWDPERTVRLGRLGYRSIQIGIPGKLVPEWVEGIVGIDDVTERARELKRVIDEEGSGEKVSDEALVERGLVPVERVFEVDGELAGILKMDVGG